MAIPAGQMMAVARYLLKQRLAGRERYPLVLMLEPLFRCNLSCTGCGKIQYPVQILRKHLSVEECVSASDECGAPIVSRWGRVSRSPGCTARHHSATVASLPR